MKSRKMKLTLLVDESVAVGLRRAVADGLAPSQSALVQEALSEYLAAREQEALRRSYADAAGDPAFIADVEAVARDFRAADDDPQLRLRS